MQRTTSFWRCDRDQDPILRNSGNFAQNFFIEIIKREQELKRELQVIRLPLVLEQLRFRLDDGAKRNQGKKKFHEHERGYEILKKTLHQLDCEFEEIQESKWKLEREVKGGHRLVQFR